MASAGARDLESARRGRHCHRRAGCDGLSRTVAPGSVNWWWPLLPVVGVVVFGVARVPAGERSR